MIILNKVADWIFRQYYPEKKNKWLFPFVALLFWTYIILWTPPTILKTFYHILRGNIELPPDTESHVGFAILMLLSLFILSILGYVVWKVV